MSDKEVYNFSIRKFSRTNTRKRETKSSSSDGESMLPTRPPSKKSRLVNNELIQSSEHKTVTNTHDFDRARDGKLFTYKPQDDLLNKGDDGTREFCQDTQFDRDAMAIFQRSMEINEATDNMNDQVYRGMNNYQHFYKKTDSTVGNAASNHVRKGPMRAPTNIRSIVRWDYHPDLCKDYKETGFCGFGDSCKFLHDRTDYKAGWMIDREIEEGKFGETEPSTYEIASDEDVGTVCSICKEPFVQAVVTKCGHYFCQVCALRRTKKTMRCFVCNKDTGGLFNPARDIIKRTQEDKSSTSDDVL